MQYFVDLFNLIVSYLQDFASASQANYNVNPWVFCIIFFGSAIPLYYGYYRIGKSALTFKNHRVKRKELDRRELKIGITISVVAWWLPYLYVMIFGRLPLDAWLLFILFMMLVGVFFIKTLQLKISKAKKDIEYDENSDLK